MSSHINAGNHAHEASGTPSRDSTAPLLPGASSDQGPSNVDDGVQGREEKPRKRDFFRFSKKGDEDKKDKTISTDAPTNIATPADSTGGLKSIPPLAVASPLRSAASPPRSNPYVSPASPGRQRLQSGSPRGLSPSTSQIFERSVQEELVPAQASPQIPSHIITENHIPPALDASSEAITNSKLDPDTVEIVTHANHQPAAAVITGATDPSLAASLHEDHIAPHISRHDADNVSNYGSLDVGDVRRLSFISFADVVHAEQELEEQRRDSTAIQSLGGHPALSAPRSPSPMRSPFSSQVPGSPSGSASIPHRGSEVSPTRGIRTPGSPLPAQSSPLANSELNIETMRQALRSPGSRDLSLFRSGSTSAMGTDS